MASLQKHRVGGRTYWRIVESRRVNGKPRPVPILYLGSADDLLNRLLEAPGGELRIRSFQHGDVAALKAAADRLGVVSIIDRHVRRRARKLSVGTTLLLAALNRAIRPRSKRGWAAWACQTSLGRLFPKLKLKTLTSQFFWDQMDCVEVEALRAIEDDLTKVVVEQLGIQHASNSSPATAPSLKFVLLQALTTSPTLTAYSKGTRGAPQKRFANNGSHPDYGEAAESANRGRGGGDRNGAEASDVRD